MDYKIWPVMYLYYEVKFRFSNLISQNKTFSNKVNITFNQHKNKTRCTYVAPKLTLPHKNSGKIACWHRMKNMVLAPRIGSNT